jgi:hypothetical protein
LIFRKYYSPVVKILNCDFGENWGGPHAGVAHLGVKHVISFTTEVRLWLVPTEVGSNAKGKAAGASTIMRPISVYLFDLDDYNVCWPT